MNNHLTNIRSLIDSGEIADAVTLLDITYDGSYSCDAQENRFISTVIMVI